MKIRKYQLFTLLKRYDYCYYTTNYNTTSTITVSMCNCRVSNKILNYVYNVRDDNNELFNLSVDNDIEILNLYTFLYINGR